MRKTSIDGPIMVAEFKGNLKEKAKKLPYILAAWCDLGLTRIVVRCLPNSDKDYRDGILNRLEHDLVQNSESVHFSNDGCDIFQALK